MLKIKHFFVGFLCSFLLFPTAAFSQNHNLLLDTSFGDLSKKTVRMELAASIMRFLLDQRRWYEGKPPTRKEMEAEQSRFDYIQKLMDVDLDRYRKEFLKQLHDPLAKNIRRFHSYSRLQTASKCLAADYLSLGKKDEVLCYHSILGSLESFRDELMGEDEIVEFHAAQLRKRLIDLILGASGFWEAYREQQIDRSCRHPWKEYLGGCQRGNKSVGELKSSSGIS